MSDPEFQSIERELNGMRPARLPEAFSARLLAACPAPVHAPVRRVAPAEPGWADLVGVWFRRLAPMTAVVVTGLLLWIGYGTGGGLSSRPATAMRADDVRIDKQLVSTFDAIAELPGGEPVRVRCEEWVDDVTLKDARTGTTIQQRTPRMEIVSVQFEVY